jgi:hypothetical protein
MALRSTVRIALALLALTTCSACDREKEVRNRECRDFDDWSSHAGDAFAQAVPDSEKTVARTNAQEAAIYRRLAEGARQSARTPIPFTDPYVRDLALKRLAIFDAVAVALDHQADAWARGDKTAIQRALDEELSAQSRAPPLFDEWRHHCTL